MGGPLTKPHPCKFQAHFAFRCISSPRLPLSTPMKSDFPDFPAETSICTRRAAAMKLFSISLSDCMLKLQLQRNQLLYAFFPLRLKLYPCDSCTEKFCVQHQCLTIRSPYRSLARTKTTELLQQQDLLGCIFPAQTEVAWWSRTTLADHIL